MKRGLGRIVLQKRKEIFRRFKGFSEVLKFSLLAAILAVVLVNGACRQQKTEMLAFAPAETVMYLEFNDLGAILETLSQSRAIEQNNNSAEIFARLKNTQAAIIISGFESSEKQLDSDTAILDFKPQFVLVADTNSWQRTNISLIENRISPFVKNAYGNETKLETSAKDGLQNFVWTAQDGRKFFAAVDANLIYLANSESGLNQVLSIKETKTESLEKNESLREARSRARDGLAFGYVAPAGISRLAELAGVSTAVKATEEDLTRSFIARILPLILQKTVKEVSWIARQNEQGIEDKIYVKTDARVSDIWKETLASNDGKQFQTAEFLPLIFDSATRYDLRNPQIAWRSILLTLSNQLDSVDGKIWLAASGSFFAPYGVSDAETFLSAVNSEILTVRLNAASDESVVVAQVKDETRLKSALLKEFDFKSAPEKIGGANVWKSAESELHAGFIDNKVIIGRRQDVLACLEARESGKNFTKTIQYQSFLQSDAAAKTITRDAESAAKIAGILNLSATKKDAATFYTTETRFNANGIERRTVSDFGLMGTLLQQFIAAE